MLDRQLFREVSDYHLSFRLRCDQRDFVFTDDLVFHTLELPKYSVPSDNELCRLPDLERWFSFLKQAGQRDVNELAKLLDDEIFSEAAGVLEMISQSPEDRQFYEARLKVLHDEEARLIAASEQAREEGREEGMVHGTLIGKIQMLQEIVGDPTTKTIDLKQQSSAELTARLANLQDRLRSRGD